MENKKLSIAILFCDKDSQYIPDLITSLLEQVMCDYEIILVDNRDNCEEGLPWLKDFLKLGSFAKYIKSGRNLAQLSAKKNALASSSGDYIWFIDADDEPGDAISQVMLNGCNEDIVCFNYGYRFSTGRMFDNASVAYIENFIEPRVVKANKYKNTDDILNKICCTCWNKWFKRSLLNSFFDLIPDDKKISCGEDTWICSVALNRAKTLREDPHFMYLNNKERGISNRSQIESLEAFTMIIQGWNETHALYQLEFKSPCKLYSYTTRRHKDILYLVNRLAACVDELQPQAFKILKSYLSDEEIKILNSTILTNYFKLRYLLSL